jgi:outer membrane protein OmpA-like peptidoglycan-associated protein
VKHSSYVLFLVLLTLGAVRSQSKLATDQAGCVDSKILPKLLECRIDHCDQKDADRREVSVDEDEKGDAVAASIEGSSRAVMYECREGTTPASIVGEAATALKAAGFEIPYKFSDTEAALTARKDDLFVTVDAASRFYTLTEIRAAPPDFESMTDAQSIAEMIERYGRVPMFEIEFLGGRADLAASSSGILGEVAAMLKDHPGWRLRVEAHNDNRTGGLSLSSARASAVVAWLAANGIKRSRLDPHGMGDTRPVADNTTEAGRKKNRRIELVRIPPPGQ